MRPVTSANTSNALLGLLVMIVPFLGFPLPVKNIILAILGLLIIIFALASSNFGQHDPSREEKH